MKKLFRRELMFKIQLKKKIALSIVLCFIFSCFIESSVNAEAMIDDEMKQEISLVYDSLPNNLKKMTKDYTGENIMLYDEEGKIINEIHSDGRIYYIKWEKDRITQVSDSFGSKTLYEYLDNGNIVENIYYNNKLQKSIYHENIDRKYDTISNDSILSNKKQKFAEAYSKGLIDSSAFDEFENGSSIVGPMADTDYMVKGKRMNSLLVTTDFIYKSDKAMTESEIQTFLTNKKSVLKDTIKIYAINSSGNAYDTGRSVKPSNVIYNAAKNEKINPKVILVMLQKESSLITSTDSNVNRRGFHYAMGYGATDGGDITTYTGFDKQVQLASKWMYTKWLNDSEMLVYKTVNGGKSKTIDGVTYKGEIYVDTYPAWVLYTYTPHVIDYSLAPTIGGGNYLFLQVFDGWWSSWY